jgi:hypothetical protein
MLDQMEIVKDDAAVLPVFSRHETFHPRYGWLKKAYDAALTDPSIFLREDAPVVLGVGKNMVRAIRYWAEAFKILGRQPNSERPRLDDSIPTAFGTRLFGEDGRDPFLEDKASLWLLHWTLLEPQCLAPSWLFTMGSTSNTGITADRLEAKIRKVIEEDFDWAEVAPNSVKKDVRCMLKMYAAAASGRDLPEDGIDSPFAELGLLQPLPGRPGAYSLNEGTKLDLPDLLVGYACVRFMSHQESEFIPFARLASEVGSPGAVFKLTESQVVAAVERCAADFGGLSVTSSAGSSILTFSEDAVGLADALLEGMFDRETPAIVA